MPHLCMWAIVIPISNFKIIFERVKKNHFDWNPEIMMKSEQTTTTKTHTAFFYNIQSPLFYLLFEM